MGLQKRLPLTGIQVKFEWCIDIRKTSPKPFLMSKPPSIARFLSQRWLRLHHDACACYRRFFSPCTDWGWRPKELYEFWIGKLPLFIMKLQFPMCLVNWNDHVTWNDHRMRCNDNGIFSLSPGGNPRFSCATSNSRRYLFCQERFALTNSGEVFWAGETMRHEENP